MIFHQPRSNRLTGLQFLLLFCGLMLLVCLPACATTQTVIPIQTKAEEPTTIITQTAPASPSTNTELSPTIPAATSTIEQPDENTRPADTAIPGISATDTAQPPTPRPTLSEDAWKTVPVIPVVSENARLIYLRGLQMGNDPHAFSKIGDCQNVESYFLSPFAYPEYYNLAQYSYLQETIDWFTNSFTRESQAVQGGYNVAAVLSPMRSNPDFCDEGEAPVACEIRLHRPSIAIISMETWWADKPGNYEKYMRQLLDYTIQQGVLPILATKADNLEGEDQINKALVKLAWEYDIPLWNFWLAVQPLPNHGLTGDGFHLSLGNYMYNDRLATKAGWSVRNLTALQALDAVWRGVSGQPIPTPSQP